MLSDRLGREDAHFSVVWTPPEPAPAAPPAAATEVPPAPAAPAPSGDDPAARENHGFRRVEVLPGNVGLIELTLLGHFEPDQPIEGSARAVADAALALVARTQALIVDLRDCRGGSPAMVGYLIGHFVAEDADVYNTFKSRGPDQFERPTVPITAPRRLDLPLFVVVSGRTGSGGGERRLHAAGGAARHRRRRADGGRRQPRRRAPGGRWPVHLHFRGQPREPDHGPQLGRRRSPTRPRGRRRRRSDRRLRARARGRSGANARRPGARTRRAGLSKRRRPSAIRRRSATSERARYAGRYGGRDRPRQPAASSLYVHDRRPPRRLLSLGADTFVPQGLPYVRLEFERDANGGVAALVVRQVSGGVARFVNGSRHQRARRSRVSLVRGDEAAGPILWSPARALVSRERRRARGRRSPPRSDPAPPAPLVRARRRRGQAPADGHRHRAR